MNYYKTALSKYAVFEGRSRRSEYWYFFLFNFIISIILGVVDGALSWGVGERVGILGALFSLAMVIPSIAVAIRRLHDIGKSGWWILIALIPLIGAIVLIIFALQDSQPGNNQYGPNPKGVGNSGPSAGNPTNVTEASIVSNSASVSSPSSLSQ